MAAIHDVLRYLLERVPHSTQDEYDRIAAVIDQDQSGAETTRAHIQEERDRIAATSPPAEQKEDQS